MNTVTLPTPGEWIEMPEVIEELECDLASAKFYLMETRDLIGAIDTLTGTESEYRTDADFGFKEAALVLAQSEEVPEDYTSLEDLRASLVDIEQDQKRAVEKAERDLAAAKAVAYDEAKAYIEAEMKETPRLRRLGTLGKVLKILQKPVGLGGLDEARKALERPSKDSDNQ